MNSFQEYLRFVIHLIICLPHFLLFLFHKNRQIIQRDIEVNVKVMEKEMSRVKGFFYLLTFCKQFRNLFYYRTRPFSFFLNIYCPQRSSLIIQTQSIGLGMSIVHGIATLVGAKAIGENFIVFQQVTIGGTQHGAPVIKDNVVIYSGAVVIGKITIGNNVVIGANATVYRDVPDNSLVLPGTSKIMRRTSLK
jgi:serine O-acetyltransferase